MLSRGSLAWGSSPRRRDDVKTHLAKMAIGRKGLHDAELAHDREARAISERKILVAILKEQMTRFLEAVCIDAFPPQSRASIDLLPPGLCRMQTEPKPDERQRFIDNEIRRDQSLSGFECRVTCRARSNVVRVGAVRARQPPRRIDEECFHLPYRRAS